MMVHVIVLSTCRDYNSLKQEHERLKSEIARYSTLYMHIAICIFPQFSEQKQLKDLKEQLERYTQKYIIL